MPCVDVTCIGRSESMLYTLSDESLLSLWVAEDSELQTGPVDAVSCVTSTESQK